MANIPEVSQDNNLDVPSDTEQGGTEQGGTEQGGTETEPQSDLNETTVIELDDKRDSKF